MVSICIGLRILCIHLSEIFARMLEMMSSISSGQYRFVTAVDIASKNSADNILLMSFATIIVSTVKIVVLYLQWSYLGPFQQHCNRIAACLAPHKSLNLLPKRFPLFDLSRFHPSIQKLQRRKNEESISPILIIYQRTYYWKRSDKFVL